MDAMSNEEEGLVYMRVFLGLWLLLTDAGLAWAQASPQEIDPSPKTSAAELQVFKRCLKA
jgi:hypothetical protein